MGNLVFQATLGGQVNLVGPNTASTFNLNVPAVSATLATTDANTFTAVQTLTAGSASAPALTTTGDANTGLFFPAADTVGITTGGTERLRVDSSGNLGLGVTPSAWAAGNKVLSVGSYASLMSNASNGNYQLVNNAYNNGTNNIYVNTNYATLYQSYQGQHQWYNAPSGTAGNAITFTQAMTLDASGNLIVGGTTAVNSASGRGNITINGSSSAILNFTVGGTWYGHLFHDGTNLEMYNNRAGANIFYTNGSERARIDSSGNLLVGATASPSNNASFYTQNRTGTNAIVAKDTVSNNIFQGLNSSNTTVILIAANGNVTNTNNSYGAISDVKLKENITDATPKLEQLCQVRVVNYNLKSDPENKQLGVIAQELEQVFPSMVEESSDKGEENNDLGTTTKSVKYSVFVPMLIKAIQEQQAIIETLTSRITALEQA